MKWSLLQALKVRKNYVIMVTFTSKTNCLQMEIRIGSVQKGEVETFVKLK